MGHIKEQLKSINKYRSGNISVGIVLAMFISAVCSFFFVFYDATRPAAYKLLWLLPASFGLLCSVVFYYKKYLFTRVSLTIMTGFYWIRMVVTPVVMSLGKYAIIPQNTSFFAYMDKAIVLACYEAAVIFIALAVMSRHLKKKSVVNRAAVYFPQKYSQVFIALLFSMIGFMALMILSDPNLLRMHFIPIWGAPAGWKLNSTIGRSLDGSGYGPLGIFVTMMPLVFCFLQILLPPVLVNRVLIKQEKRSPWMTAFLALIIVGFVFIVATESRAYSVICAVSVLFVIITLSDRNVRKYCVIFLVGALAAGICMLWIKQGAHDIGYSTMQSISRILTSYFSGPQNIAASLQAGNELKTLGIALLPADIMQSVPYALTLIAPLMKDGLYTSNHLFNEALYGYSLRTDQILPAVGMGYLYFGFVLAPVVPLFTAWMAVRLEKIALNLREPLWKNILYVAAIFMSFCQVPNNGIQALQHLWYVMISALIALPTLYSKNKIKNMRDLL